MGMPVWENMLVIMLSGNNTVNDVGNDPIQELK